ncbi:hypothetical protein TNCV_1206241 [Trichonephila clavipes]|nr:hypothetical protein TNCV_1206241 [Trichonephila clavipes]
MSAIRASMVSDCGSPDNFKKDSLKRVGTPNVQPGSVSLKPSTIFPLKRASRFHSDDEAKEAFQEFLDNQPQSFYREDIDLLPKQLVLFCNTQRD